MHDTKPPARVLVVDDEPAVLHVLSRLLRRKGHDVLIAPTGPAAIAVLTDARRTGSEISVILSDVAMPGMSGIDLLRAVRAEDPDVPVLLMTGGPTVASAAAAVKYGAMQYLVKPIEPTELEESIEQAAKLHRLARMKRLAMAATGHPPVPADRAGLEAAFERALAGLSLVYQPILSASARMVVAYEALMRSEDPSMPEPLALLDAAERLERIVDLGRAVRRLAARDLRTLRDDRLLLVNLHPLELEDPDLVDPASPLSALASHVVLEITERITLDGINNLSACVTRLRKLGYRIAIDDLGAGYAGLTSFAHLEPEFVKLDMSLVRGIDSSVKRQTIIRAVTTMCHDLGMVVVVEGVESIAERDTLAGFDCDLFQGFLFARPGPAFPEANWPAGV